MASAIVAAMLVVAATLSMLFPPSALASSFDLLGEGQVHWAYQGYTYSNSTGAGRFTLWWVLEDAAGEWVDNVNYGDEGNPLDPPSFGKPQGQSTGIWCTTTVDATFNADTGLYEALTRDEVSANAPSAAVWPAIGSSKWAAADAVAPTNGGLGFAQGWTGGGISSIDRPQPNPTVDGSDWIRGYATGETDASGNVVTDPEAATGNAEKPEFDLFDWWGSGSRCIANWLYTSIVAPIILGLTQVGTWLLSAIDPTQIFTTDFEGGSFATFYDIARRVNDSVAVPYATAALVIVFALGLFEPGRMRGQVQTDEWVDRTLMRIVMLFAAYTLVTHALDALYLVYWLGANAAAYITELLRSAGIAVGGASLAGSIMQQMTDVVAQLTYDQFGIGFLLVIIAAIIAWSCWTCMSKVFVICFLRMAEIYLRAAVSAVPFALLAGDKTRHMCAAYMRRFGAVCFQAALIVVCLAMMGPINDVCNTIIAAALPASPGTGVVTVFADVVRVCIPLLISISVATAAVEKTEPIANGLFGMA